MPYNSKDWKAAVYRGQTITGVREHKKDDSRFILDVSVRKIRRKKIIVIDGTISERYQKAIRAYSDFRANIYEGFFLDASTFEEQFNRWLLLKQPTRWTNLQKQVYCNHIQKHLGALNLRDIRPKHIDAVVIDIKHMAAASRKGVMGIIKSVLKLSIADKIIKVLPLEDRHHVRVNALQQKTIVINAETKYQAVHKSIMTVYAHDPKWRAIFLLGLNGRRKSEILSLQWDHVSLESKTYIIKGTYSKVKQDFTFIIPGDVLEALEEIMPNNPKGLIFPNPNTGKQYSDIRHQVQKIRNCSGWGEFGFHRMRNLTVSALFSAGVNPSHLSSLLGHTDPQILKQYLSLQREKSGWIVEDAAKKLLNQELK